MKEKLNDYFSIGRSLLVRAVIENIPLKIVSVLLTLTIFALVAGESVQVSKRVTIEYVKPEQMMIVNSVPSELELVLSGQKSAVGIVRGREYVYLVDLSAAGPGPARVNIDTGRLGLPRGVIVSSILPSKIYPVLEKVITKHVPIQLRYQLAEKVSFDEVHLRVEPAQIEISGPESEINKIDKIQTETLDLRNIHRNKTLEVNFPPLHSNITILDKEKLKVFVEFKKKK